jgi:hypothetical protein
MWRTLLTTGTTRRSQGWRDVPTQGAQPAILRDMSTEPTPSTSQAAAILQATRSALHQVAVHVLGRRRYAVAGRFGLRPTPGGFGTPAFGEGPQVVRTSGQHLVVEHGADAVTVELRSLAQAAEVAGADLSTDFSVGDDTPAMVDPDEPLAIDPVAARLLARWYAWGSLLLDEVVASTPSATTATTWQLWPEHFDLGGTVSLVPDEADALSDYDDDNTMHVNLGASPGDDSEPMPYLYVGPWTDDRPGDPDYWNAPFGAVLRRSELAALPRGAARRRALDFLIQGIQAFSPPKLGL